MSDHARPLTSTPLTSAPAVPRAPLLRVLRGHPSEGALERHYVRHAAATRVDRHLAGCAECQGWLRWRVALGTAARDLAGHPAAADAPPDVLAAALRRRAAGDRVMIPSEPVRAPTAPPAPATSRRGAWAGAVAAGLALAAALLARPVRSADAGLAAGELTFVPGTPRAGDTLTLRYRPSAQLAGVPRLRLRATFHPDDDTRPWGRPAVTAAWLAPGTDGDYRTRVVLPPGTAYARFAVEDSAAHAVDAHGHQPWDVVLADVAGRPRIAGIRSQAMAADWSMWERMRAFALEATRLYPDHPSGWWQRTQQDVELVGSARADSVAAASRPLVTRLDTALGRAAVRESWAMLDLASFAEFAGLSAVAQRWRARLAGEAPRSVAAYSLRMQRLWSAKASPVTQLDSLERWWTVDGDSVSLFMSQSVGLALASHDTAAARRWAARVVQAHPVASVFVAQQLVRDPALAAAGVGYARAALAVVGEGLLALMRPRDAAAALAEATADGWNADAFRLLGEARLASADTVGALNALAYAAADPSLGRQLADSLGARLGGRVRDDRWTRAVADARRAMHARVLGSMVAEPLPGDPHLGAINGSRRRLSAVTGGRIAVVAMVNAHCGSVLADLPAVAQLRAGLAGQPVTFVAVTREAPGEGAEQALRARGLTAPLWYDLDGEATVALDARGTPTYLVLDRAGTVRWRGYRIREAAPVLDALLAGGKR